MHHPTQASQRVSKSGCVRAEGIRVAKVHGPRGPRVTRILAKAVGDGSTARSDSAEGTVDQDELEENLREVENQKLLYAELASAYLLDPGSRLEVTRNRYLSTTVRNKTVFCIGTYIEILFVLLVNGCLRLVLCCTAFSRDLD